MFIKISKSIKINFLLKKINCIHKFLLLIYIIYNHIIYNFVSLTIHFKNYYIYLDDPYSYPYSMNIYQ